MATRSIAPKEIYKAFNAVTRKYEEVDIDLGEFMEGDRVVKMFWCNSAKKYVTIPGCSLIVLTEQGWVIDND